MSPRQILLRLKKVNYLAVAKELAFFGRFFLLVIAYLFFDLVKFWGRLPLLKQLLAPLRPPVRMLYHRIMNLFNSRAEGDISSLDLITLAVRHLKMKKSRTLITIGGMSIGFGSVIFLLSLGYGVQRLVVSRVARLDEMKQVNVTVGQASSLVINDQTLATFRDIEQVTSVIPMISVVSKVNYNNSVSDVVAYGVTKEFLEQSAIQPVRGGLFEDAIVTSLAPPSDPSVSNNGQVAGASHELLIGAKLGKQLAQVRYSIYPLVWKPVYAEPSTKSEIIGYTTRSVGELDAVEVWGHSYLNQAKSVEGVDAYGNLFQPWIQDTVPLWKKTPCVETAIDCVDGEYQVIRHAGQQELVEGYLTETETTVDRYRIVAETSPEFVEGAEVEQIQFTIKSGQWVSVYADTFSSTALLNLFTSQLKTDLPYTGTLVFGESYYNSQGWGVAGQNKNGADVGYWIRAKLPLWRRLDCTDCDNLYLKEVDTSDQQVVATSFIRADQVQIENMTAPPQFGRVLGDATGSASLADDATDGEAGATDEFLAEDASGSGLIAMADGTSLRATKKDDGSVDWVSIASESGAIGATKREVLTLPDSAQKVAVVNRAMLKVLAIPEDQAVGQVFNTTFMLDQEFFSQPDYQAESAPADYKIIGVIPDDKTPAFYLPFSDLKTLGVQNYTQVKLVVENQNDIKAVRQTIEAGGYRTSSVVDTVGKINDLFGTIRFVLSILGMVALSVAALGMFNTLTVSLLEKTREVGLMKAIGMKSNEVKRLFLAESIVMGLAGGIFGLVLSVVAGQLLSFILSILSVTKGLGYIQLVYIPVYLGAGVIGLAFLIGVATGLYPSYRATKISALNALRYE